MKPVLFVTNHAPPFRVGAFAKLHEREDVVFALIGGDVRHGGGARQRGRPPVPGHPPAAARGRPAGIRLPRGGGRAVRARRAVRGVPRRPARTRPVRALGEPVGAPADAPPRRLVLGGAPPVPARRCDRHLRAARVGVRALQRAPSNRFSRPRRVSTTRIGTDNQPQIGARRSRPRLSVDWRGKKDLKCSFRPGVHRALTALSAALVLVGGGPIRARAVATGAVLPVGPQPPAEVRNFYAGSDVVVVPSVATRDFREPWGLVVNEAFNQGVPVIATDAVGAVAGGLVRHERTGLVVPAGDVGALAAALRRMHDEPELRRAPRAPPGARRSRPTRTTRGRPACRTPCKAWEQAVASVEGHGSSADAQRADPAARCPAGERGRPREDPARVPERPHHRQLHAGAAARRSPPHPHRPRRVLGLPRRALARRRWPAARRAMAAAVRPRRAVEPRPRPGGAPAGGQGGDDVLVPGDQAEKNALGDARTSAAAVTVDGERILPGLAAKAARHGLPAPLLAVLVLLGLCALVAAIPSVRRRVIARRASQ